MPIYLSTIERGLSTEPQRAKIANHIMMAHCDVTGAPEAFVNTFFREDADVEGGFRPLPEGTVVFVNGNIRSGRDEAAKAEIIARITAGVVEALGCAPTRVAVVLDSGPASHCMEGGSILPEPGSPEERAWRERTVAEARGRGAGP